MALQVRKIQKSFGPRQVVQGVSFDVADGELVALLGPSGSGKSTILRIIAGLTDCDAGSVEVDGVDVTGAAPQSRDLGFVFQNYALFEHMSVAENIEFALRVRGVPRPDRARRRDELLEQVGLGGSARKFPAQLSGGQRQRTALARALAHRPRLLLLDEPFGALDAQIRQELRQGLRDLLKEIGTTAVFVTHDQEEAFAVADRIMVLHRGRLLEQGAPEALYGSPRTEFVARFVGRANVLPGEMTPSGVRVRLGRRPDARALPKRVKVLFRPERLLLLATDDNQVPRDAVLLSRDAEVRHIEYLGASERIDLDLHAEDDGAPLPQFTVSVLRSVDQRNAPSAHVGKSLAVYGRRPHAITEPSLRLLVLADDTPDGRRALEAAVDFAEREHCLLTVLGGVVRAAGLRQRLEQWRQSFAGDLGLLDPQEMGLSSQVAARTHLGLERYDLVVLPARSLQEAGWFDLLRLSGVHHVLATSDAASPLSGQGAPLWSLLLNRFAASHPDLGLFGELAQLSRAKIALHGQDDDAYRNYQEVQPSLTSLLLRSINVSIANPTAAKPAGNQTIPAGDLVAVDLGPRSRLGAAQRVLLQQLGGRWSLLIVQPDEVDVELSAAPFMPAPDQIRQPARAP